MALRRAIDHLFSGALRLAGLPRLPEAGQRVLLYHSVGTKLPEGMGPMIEIARFKEHMDLLAERRDEWRPTDFGIPSSTRREVAVVFDDGYRDSLSVAAPMLAERKIPFTVFVIPRAMQERSPYHLTFEQLKELAAFPGAQIGAHGFSHVHLKKLADSRLRIELEDSRKFLQDLLGREVTMMSYPFGSVDRRVAEAAGAAGFKVAGTSRWGFNRPGQDPLLLRRTEVLETDTPTLFEWKLRGHADWYVLRQALRP